MWKWECVYVCESICMCMWKESVSIDERDWHFLSKWRALSRVSSHFTTRPFHPSHNAPQPESNHPTYGFMDIHFCPNIEKSKKLPAYIYKILLKSKFMLLYLLKWQQIIQTWQVFAFINLIPNKYSCSHIFCLHYTVWNDPERGMIPFS